MLWIYYPMQTEHLDSSWSQKSQRREKTHTCVHIFIQGILPIMQKEGYLPPQTVLGSIKAVHFTTLAPVLLKDEEIQRPMIMGYTPFGSS